LIPNPDFLFHSSTHTKALTYLDYGIKERVGFILLTGEIGSGKTTIIRNLVKNLNGSVKLSRVNNTKGSSEQLLSMINEDFGLEIEGKSKTKLLSELNEFLIDQYSNRIRPVLLIDEAQNLSPDLLEEIRLLSNLETDKAKLLQIILVGQPEMKKTLMRPELMQLRQRININYHLTPLTAEETEKYIKHRLSVAGNPDAIKLKGDMLFEISRFSKGIPRLINILCDFALLAAFVDGQEEVNVDVMREVIKDLESRDYWGEDEEDAVRKTVRHEDGPELLEAAGGIALRLISLEETLRISVSERKSLSDKVEKLEDVVSRLSNSGENDRITGLLERLEDKLACRVLVRISEENKIPELLERISKLERMLISEKHGAHLIEEKKVDENKALDKESKEIDDPKYSDVLKKKNI
jgi:putative secretion ATPase (PEP-CTERM system associated)